MFVFVFFLIKITNLIGNKKNMILIYNKFFKNYVFNKYKNIAYKVYLQKGNRL